MRLAMYVPTLFAYWLIHEIERQNQSSFDSRMPELKEKQRRHQKLDDGERFETRLLILQILTAVY